MINTISNQQTINSPFAISGIGLHTGKKATIRFNAAPPNHGIKFSRTDIAGSPLVEAVAEHVTDTARGTTIACGDAAISTIEHVLAAVSALGIDNLIIEIDAEEVPILDGSAIEFVKGFKSAGILNQGIRRNFYTITEAISFADEKRGVLITASPLTACSPAKWITIRRSLGFSLRQPIVSVRLKQK